jgi:hypothetical protein
LVNTIDPTLNNVEFPSSIDINPANLKAYIVNTYKNPYSSLNNDLVVESISQPSDYTTYYGYAAILSEVAGSYVFMGKANISFKQAE